ncbi:MAG: CapA family protein [Candidatus Peribacteraceae bacterium]|nr:CapA family protein [Candidatus Peribacteraceae bacterium]
MAKVILSAVGDVFVGGLLSEDVNKYKNTFLSEDILNILKTSQIRFCNLESPLCKVEQAPNHRKTLLHAKEESIEFIKKAGFNVVSLANNHMMDFGGKSLEKTIKILDDNKIKHVGAGKTLSEARKPAVIISDDMKIAFLAYSWAIPQVKEGAIAATTRSPGVAPYNLEIIKEDVIKAKKIVDFVIVSIHWQEEFSHYPPPETIADAHKITESGADIILGHHPHVLQGYEEYNNNLIFYSLSNFIFSPWYATNQGKSINYEREGRLRQWYKERREGAIIKFSFNVKGIDYDIFPTYQETKTHRVIVLKNKDADKIMKNIEKWSSEYTKDSYIDNYDKFVRRENKLKFVKGVRNEIDTYGFKVTIGKAKAKILKEKIE